MVDASSLIIPRFHDVLGDVMAHGYTHCWLFSGRGSTKSSFISLAIVLVMLATRARTPWWCAGSPTRCATRSSSR